MEVEIPNQQKLRWKKILLIKPNSGVINTNIHQAQFDAPPLNLTYIASYLEDLNVDVKILDAKVNNLNYRQISQQIKAFDPEIVGISVSLSFTVNICNDIAKIVKLINQNCIVVFGGRHVTAVPDETLKIYEVDIVVRGEGELTFRELILKGSLKDVDGISYKSNGKILHNSDRELMKDYENIRIPARHLTKENKYKMLTVRFESVETSRGCPYKCKFCSTPVFYKGLWRPRPVENIITELELISKNRKITDIFFIDDNFIANPNRIDNLCDRIIECKKKGEISDLKFVAQIRVDSVIKAPQLVEKMAKAGFAVVFIGIESVSTETLKDIKKGFTFKKVLRAIKVLHENGIFILANMIIGVDLNASFEQIKNQIRYMKKVDIEMLGFSLLVPFPGTYMLKEMEEKNLVMTKDWSLYTFLNPVIKTNVLNQKELQDLLYFSIKEHSYLSSGVGLIKKTVKLRGLLFVLNPYRIFSLFKTLIKMKILLKKLLSKND